jgi:hypothetical protein
MPTYKHTPHGLSLAPFAILAALGLTACPADDDDDPTNATTVATLSTTNGESTGPSESSGNADTTVTASTTTPAESSGGEESSTGEACPMDAECQDDTQCPGGSCISCICIGAESTGGECPAGETCEMTGGGGMACLAPADHCVLACGGAMACPDSMTCQGGACQYDGAMLPEMGDANYPVPGAMGECPDDGLAVSFAMGYAVCSPPCDGTGPMAACPQGASGSAVGACLTSPTSSGMACG